MATEDKKTEATASLLQPEANDGGEQVPEVYRSLNFRSLQDPYSHNRDTMASRYSTLRADDLDTMLNGGLERFYKKYDHLSRKINLQLPTPEVRFENLSFSVQVPAEVGSHGTVGSHLASIFTPWQKIPMTTKHALHPMSGIIKPGSMTLILANPGAGKSTFLKAMAGKLQDNASTEIGGEILYSGLKGEEIDLIKLAGLVDQTDNHIPTLTVRETFKFADMCVNGRPEDQPEEMREIAALRTELMLQILGLENCADTVVGDALLRGVSGGERKRVTVGEVLVGGQSLFLCDEISTGLDSAATFDIIKALRTWCKTLGGSVMVALLQPTPEVVEHNMLSEFSSDRYTPVESQTLLDSFSITQGTEYVWFGIVVLLAYYFVFTTLNGMALHYIRYEKYKGVSVKPMTAKAEDEDNVYVEVNTPGADGAKGNSGGLPFTPSNLCIKDLEYFVTLPSGEEKQLLRGITAHFEPGRMVALMGATGAGKTTLMDVIAGRKTGGRIVGDIIVNGEQKDPANFSRITAYCEQMDIHSEAATIYEALVFSANLRLPPNFTEEERMNLVHETLDLLELTAISGAMVGSLSVEQKKRVTIGVEVVSNPSILFLDEPTSGLDARSALIVMRGVQSIARTGRTVLCTIHQPSISIFELFDGLLLLQKGGFTAYFGDLGVDSVKMLEYFASIPGTMEIRPQYNPATYMLEVIGAGIGRDVKDYSIEYKNSELYKSNRERTLKLAEVSDEFVRHSTLNYDPIATGFTNQLGQLAKKQQLTYWRNPQYNFMRMFLFPLFGIIFGTTFYQLSADSVKRINSHIGLIYNSMDFIGVINLMTVLEVTCAERAVFYRERMSNYYGPLPYSLSLFFAEVPYLVVVIILFVTIEYWLVGWSDNVGNFFFFMFVFYLYTSACTFVGQWMSALMPNEKVANVAVGALSCLFNLFSGYLLPRPAMKAGYKWFTYLMPSSYSLSALVGVQLGEVQDIISVTSGNTTTEMTVAQYVEDTYDFRPDSKYNFMVGLIVIWAVLQVAIYLTFKYVSHLKR
ncbi:ABC transporter G family member 37 [Phytophthora ramorum]|uniref:ABC transporter G family member 37 n=1 Tax=Phytophthora ramorum TaxID=164328 RepID=UPI00309887D1|nr:ABC transporter G family member 37 [Phytophthora ramorum]